jgi:Domain of unknown function (DUF4389)
MSENPETTVVPHAGRSIWVRGLLTVVMAFAFQLTASLLGLVAVVQFVLMLVSDAPNPRLADFGQALGRYLRQIADFVSFGTEEAPFPFSDWPGR